jgi:hypothetical protein
MTTMMNEEVRLASEKVLEHGLPEVLPEEFHEAIEASWEMPAYEREVKTPPSRRPLVVGLIAGALGLAIGAGAGFYAQPTRMPEPEPIAITDVDGHYDGKAGGGDSTGVLPEQTFVPAG